MTDRVAWPNGLTRQPWAHQHEAYDVLGRLWYGGQPGVGLISGMGTGKSLVATALFQAFGFRRVLLVSGAKAMVEEWPDMLADYTSGSLEGLALTGKLDDRAARLLARADSREPFVAVTNVESYWSGKLGMAVERVPWDVVVFDESQKIKGAGSKASLFAYRMAKLHPQALRLIMTGTPLHDKPLDVYGQFRFVDPRVFGTNQEAFKRRYAIEQRVAQNVYKVVGYVNLDELADKLHTISFRAPENVIDLPPLVEREWRVRLSDKTVKLYHALRTEGVAKLDGVDDAVISPNSLVSVTRLQQLTSGFTVTYDAFGNETEHAVGTEKRDALVDLLGELDTAAPVVVFARFSHDLKAIAGAAAKAGRPYLEQSGDRDEWRTWRARDDNAVLGVQIQAGGAGIDLTRSPYVVFYSHGFSKGDFEQAVKRVHRPSQTVRTYVYHLLATVPGTRSVDLLIRAALAEKAEISTYVVDTLRKAKG